MTKFHKKDIDLNCSCGAQYEVIPKEENEALYNKLATKNETLYKCPNCESVIGIKKTTEHPEFSNINIYNVQKESTTETDNSERKDFLSDEDTSTEDDLSYDVGVNILNLKEREELNNSRINFDLSKNFLKKNQDNSKILFNINDGALKCMEKDIQECLWTLNIQQKGSVSGLYYLDYQMALFLKKKHFQSKNFSLIDSVLQGEKNKNSETPEFREPIKQKGEINNEFALSAKEKIININRTSEDIELGFQNIAPQKKLKIKNRIPEHNYFMIIDPIIGQVYLEREGQLLAHSFGMDYLYFVYEKTKGEIILEAAPTQDSISSSEFQWKRNLNFKASIIVEHDDFLIVKLHNEQDILINNFPNPKSKKNTKVLDRNAEIDRILVEKKGGNMYRLKPVYLS